MKIIRTLLTAFLVFSATAVVQAGKGSGKSSSGLYHSHSAGPGTGSKSSSERVGGYTKKDGTHVDSYRKSTPDKNFKNNWSTKGNQNPVTGKEGSKVTPPKK